MVILYNRLAEWFSFSDAAWQELLTNAAQGGWRASVVGTQTDAGQMVSPEDAAGLAAAVERALISGTRWRANNDTILRDFIRFCQQRGFVISSTLFLCAPAPSRHVTPLRSRPQIAA